MHELLTRPTAPVHIDELLGSGETHYFAEGFRQFATSITSMGICDEEISGELRVSYYGPTRPRGEEVHLGSVEYLAIACRLVSHAINRIVRIGIADMNRSFLRAYELKLKNSVFMGALPYYCRVISTESTRHSIQGSLSVFEIGIAGNIARMTVDHRGGARYRTLPQEQCLKEQDEQLHNLGYRIRTLEVDRVSMDIASKTISAAITYDPNWEEDQLLGIGSARPMLLPTEATQVFGQLMQALLYKIDGTDRQRCGNIWLRRMELSCERPQFDEKCSAYVQFDHIRKLTARGEKWQLVDLSGNVGKVYGNFQVAHQITGT